MSQTLDRFLATTRANTPSSLKSGVKEGNTSRKKIPRKGKFEDCVTREQH
jgi:hypothetical protein